MKALSMSVLFGLLCAAGSLAAASESLSPFPPKVVPVLVQVDAHGKITDASPAVKLSPRLTRLLNQNLAEMIAEPAKVRGKAVSSQFVINLRLDATPLEQDKYDVQFAYVSISPVPSGSWYWVNEDGRRLSLARQGSMHREPVYRYDNRVMPTRNRLPVSAPPANPPTPSVSRGVASSASRSPASGR
jgi:hypothetical protein